MQLDGTPPTFLIIKTILKENNLREYYENISSIINKINELTKNKTENKTENKVNIIDDCCICFNEKVNLNTYAIILFVKHVLIKLLIVRMYLLVRFVDKVLNKIC